MEINGHENLDNVKIYKHPSLKQRLMNMEKMNCKRKQKEGDGIMKNLH
jgi:hypothetical protein